MNLRFVEAFYWAVTLKSVTRAAEKLFVTQSALSSRIAALEAELGVLLLDRRDKQFRLTTAGTRFHGHAARLLNLQREIKAELGGGAVERGMALRLGVIESVLHSWLIEWVQGLRRDHPGLELALTVETSPVLLDQMRRGAVDVVLAALPAEGDGVRSRALAPMPMVFTGQRARHGRRRFTLAALAQGDELLTFQRGSQPHVALLDLCRREGVETPRVHTISSISAMVQLVEQGFGVATLPQAAVARLAGSMPLCAVRCEATLAPLPIHLSWRDDPGAPFVAHVVASIPTFERTPAKPRASSKKSIKA
ncbi:MAG: LysR family transcriptional regulator [Rubrivivax sp.]|nr:LysR family transcriptional regulator [Rubrivivax sp.]